MVPKIPLAVLKIFVNQHEHLPHPPATPPSPQREDLVLLDENLIRMGVSTPLHVRPHSMTILQRAISQDTLFLQTKARAIGRLLINYHPLGYLI